MKRKNMNHHPNRDRAAESWAISPNGSDISKIHTYPNSPHTLIHKKFLTITRCHPCAIRTRNGSLTSQRLFSIASSNPDA